MNHIVGKKLFAKNLFANWVGVFADVAVAFFLTPFIVNKLGLTIYGVWSLLNGLVGYMGLVDVGIRGSAGRFINFYLARKDVEKVNQVIVTSVVVLSLLSILVYFLATILAEYFTKIFPLTPSELINQITLILPLMAINLWMSFVNAVFTQTINAHDRFDVTNGVYLLSLLVKSVGVVYVLINDFSLYGLVGVMLVASGVNLVFSYFLSRKILVGSSISLKHFSRVRLSEMWRFGIAVFLTRGSVQLITKTDQMIIMYFFGPVMVGLYSIASMIIENSQKIIEQVEKTFHPSVVKAGSLFDIKGLSSLFIKNAINSYLIGILLYTGIIVYGQMFVFLWMGEGYKEVTIIIVILSINSLFSLYASCGQTILFSLGEIRANIILSFIQAIIGIGTVLVLITIFDIGFISVPIGALVATVIIKAVAYPTITFRRIDMNGFDYMNKVLIKVLLIFFASYFIFDAISRMFVISGWLSFFSIMSLSVLLYILLSIFIMFRREEVAKFISIFKLRFGQNNER